MSETVEIISFDSENLTNHGFFCYKSKPKSDGYRQKLDWLSQRQAEGLRMKILVEGKRSMGFIEYIPGEYAWRAVRAADYLVIHCLWVVGMGKGKGYASQLLGLCEQEARDLGMAGVAMVSSSGNWLAGEAILLKNGYRRVDQAPPTFQLMVKPFGEGMLPSFPGDWPARQARYGPGLTAVRTPQCPYIDNAAQIVAEVAEERGLGFQEVELTSAAEVQEKAPSPYGVFAILSDGLLLSYHYLTRSELLERLTQPSRLLK